MKEITVKKYDPQRLKVGIALLVLIAGLAIWALFISIAQQSIYGYPPTQLVTYEKITSWSYIAFVMVMIIATIILNKTGWLSRLEDRERKIIQFLYLREKKNTKKYGIDKELKKADKFWIKVSQKQVYRIIKRLIRYNYVYLKEGKYVYLTKSGKSLIEFQERVE